MNAMNFLLGVAMSSRLTEQRDRMMVGLAASMYPASNPLGAIMLKPQVDTLAQRESEVASLTTAGQWKQEILDLGELEVLPVGGKAEYPWSGPGDPIIVSADQRVLRASFSKDRKFVLEGLTAGPAGVLVKSSLGQHGFFRVV